MHLSNGHLQPTIIKADSAFRENLEANNLALEEVTIPGSVRDWEEGVFYSSLSLKKVTVCHGVDKIGDGAFDECTFLSDVSIPSSVTHIGKTAFQLCSALRHIHLSEGLRFIGSHAFNSTGLVHVTLPDSLEKVDRYAFFLCHRLRTISVPYKLSLSRLESDLPSDVMIIRRSIPSFLPRELRERRDDKIGLNSFKSKASKGMIIWLSLCINRCKNRALELQALGEKTAELLFPTACPFEVLEVILKHMDVHQIRDEKYRRVSSHQESFILNTGIISLIMEPKEAGFLTLFQDIYRETTPKQYALVKCATHPKRISDSGDAQVYSPI